MIDITLSKITEALERYRRPFRATTMAQFDTPVGGSGTRIEFETQKSCYQLDFDREGDLIYVEIDGVHTAQRGKRREGPDLVPCFYLDGPLGCGARLYTMERMLGCRLP